MANLSDLKKLTTPPPTGWNPGLTWDGKSGQVTSYPLDTDTPEDSVWDEVLEKFGLDHTKYMIIPPVKRTAWDVPGHGVQHSFRATIVERAERSVDIEDLLDSIYLGEIPPIPKRNNKWRTLQIGDTHIGKGKDAGGGTETIVSRWKSSVATALAGYTGNVHIAFLGDLIEGYVSQGGANISECDLTLSEQLRVARHLVLFTVEEAIKCGGEVIVSAVPGNHGETTRAQNRPKTDSHDIDVVSAVQLAIEQTAWRDKVSWFYPEAESHHVTYKVGGTIFTSAHGHLFNGQVSGAEKWWAGMTVNNQPPGASTILMCGHFHNTQISNFTENRWIMFSPSLETKSVWFNEKTGQTSLPGILSYDLLNGRPVNISVV